MSETHHTTHCLNCETPLREGAKYCVECGQKTTTGHIKISELIGEFLSDYLHLDSKFPKTIIPLFIKPGFLTNQYFEGKHQSYLRPLRLFGVATILFFAFVLFRFIDSSDVKDQLGNINQKMVLEVERKSVLVEIDSVLIAVKEEIPNKETRNLLDTAFLEYKPKESTNRDTLNFSFLDFGNSQKYKYDIAKTDVVNMKPKEIAEKYGVGGFWEKLIFTQNVKIIQNGGNFLHFIVQRFSWTFFLMMPVFALILKMLYIRRSRYYVEHLIFAFHFHAFILLYTLFLLLWVNVFPDWVYAILSIYPFVYLYKALRNVYKQKHSKNALKLFLLLGIYVFTFFIGIFCTILISFVLY